MDDLVPLTSPQPSPLVSIVIPCYNAGPYLEAALRSCLNQDYAPLEIIVVDDGSIDESLRAARSFSPRVQVIAANHQGHNAARNLGLAASTGEFVQFFDADDVLLRDKISASMQAFREDPTLDVVFTQLFSPGDWTFDEHVQVPPLPAPLHVGVVAMVYFEQGIDIPVLNASMALYRRTALQRYGTWDASLVVFDDLELNFRLYALGAKYRGLDQFGVIYRHHPSPHRVSRREKVTHPGTPPAMARVVDLANQTGRNHGALQAYLTSYLWYAAQECLASFSVTQTRAYLDLLRRVNPAFVPAGALSTVASWFGPWPTVTLSVCGRVVSDTLARLRQRLSRAASSPLS